MYSPKTASPSATCPRCLKTTRPASTWTCREWSSGSGTPQVLPTMTMCVLSPTLMLMQSSSALTSADQRHWTAFLRSGEGRLRSSVPTPRCCWWAVSQTSEQSSSPSPTADTLQYRYDQGSNTAKQLSAPYLECSSLQSENSVRDIFHVATLACVNKNNKNMKRRKSSRATKRMSQSGTDMSTVATTHYQRTKAKSCAVM
uniref:Rho family GTPase 3b n=1 Tax=Lates calcarifer TaxID=8187 RepID=A0A4W6G5W6_LATCA